MKHVVVVLAALTLTASAAFAYVQPVNLTPSPAQVGKTQVIQPGDGQFDGHFSDRGPGRGVNRPRTGDGPVSGATNPVPEPATLTLASMGLIALGTALNRRRRKLG
jgi:hypothetical protein